MARARKHQKLAPQYYHIIIAIVCAIDTLFMKFIASFMIQYLLVDFYYSIYLFSNLILLNSVLFSILYLLSLFYYIRLIPDICNSYSYWHPGLFNSIYIRKVARVLKDLNTSIVKYFQDLIAFVQQYIILLENKARNIKIVRIVKILQIDFCYKRNN
jgi:hypothetical protein